MLRPTAVPAAPIGVSRKTAKLAGTPNNKREDTVSITAETKPGHIYGAWQQPVNKWQGLPNSIHTDAVAEKVGMRGGTIPGSVHLGHFRPILDQLFGERWLKTCAISMYYTFATVDREEVRAVVKAPPQGASDALMDAWVETKEGKVVAKGSLSVGKPQGTPYVSSLPLEQARPGSTRILSRMKVGAEIPADNNFVMAEGENGVVHDPVDMFRALRIVFPDLLNQPVVGFFGASEVVLHDGPIKSGVPYRKTGKVICVGDSNKTEFAWFESYLHDKDGKLIASMRHLNRWMKVSSPLWKAA
jgi:hypothetical protein